MLIRTLFIGCVLEALLFIIHPLGSSAGATNCTLYTQLSKASFLVNGETLLDIPYGCSLLGSLSQPLTISTSLTLRGNASNYGSLDVQFAEDAVLFTPGSLLSIESLDLRNVRIESAPFLQLAAFNASKQQLLSVTITTDCLTLSNIANASNASSFVHGPGYVYVQKYTSSSVNASSVNITCDLPTIQRGADGQEGEFVSVIDSLQLLNAFVASQLPATSGGSSGQLTIKASANISLSARIWKPKGLVVKRGVTLLGDPTTLNIFDVQGLSSVIVLDPGVTLNIANFCFVNIGPLRGTLSVLGMLPVFSLPMWFVSFRRVPSSPQLVLTNVTLAVQRSEYQYYTLWTVVVTTQVTPISMAAAVLRSTSPVIELMNKTSSTGGIMFSHLRSSGIDLFNSTLTNTPPAGPFDIIVPDNPNLQFNLNILSNMTQLAIYDLDDMLAILQAMQETPPPMAVVLFVLKNITIDPSRWPSNGFNLTQPILLVGQQNLDITTWIDFRRIPHFVRVFGCAPEMYVYVQGLMLLNLPNVLAKQVGSSSGGASAAVQSAAATTGLDDVSVYLSSPISSNMTCYLPTVFTNQSVVAITYAEFQHLHAAVVKGLGTSVSGSDTVLGSTVDYNLTSVVKDRVSFLNLRGWGWSGYKLDVTYKFPDEVPILYNNSYYNPSPPPPQTSLFPPPPTTSSGGGDGLKGWAIAVIVVGASLLVALVAGLIAWRIVTRLRHEVEAVKSGSSDKKSSSASGDQEAAVVAHGHHATGGAALGSSGGVGASCRTGAEGGSGAGGGDPASPVNAKSCQGGGASGGGGGGTGGGEGTSDDSAAAQSDKPPLEVLNNMMAALTQEMDDQHLTILEVIGQGGFGVVYKGLWKGLNVAVKTITFQDRVAGGEKGQQRAILEAAISSSLAHPNVVTTYSYDIKPLTVRTDCSGESPRSGPGGVGTGIGGLPSSSIKIIDKRPVLDWKLYLVQEYCDGGSLRTAILKRKFFDAKRGEARIEMILDTALELTGGLVHLHERNIIHGDLNPNNVLLKRDPTKKYGATCKLADFGLSIKMAADQSHISNMRRGTPFYTCPQILAKGNMTKAADVYSMGVMMWEMFHCCMSYRSLPSGFVARENFPNFSRKAPHEFARLVGACLDSEPAQRPTFVQLRDALAAQLAAFKRGELRSGEEVLGPDLAGDAAHMAACQD
ncbi:hypothetical protein Agub_g2695 [Astrephomene gubernaculifera]|uniref:Protein kinase domain-containing protein n=1 Tax=Astrephomene gubernaculifera TaxID=47775 RepID=A0AAD3DHH5_9CHLO|nr:hypothetical protein Agub_g2695 [Astrephomene gubernaculifera]